MASYLTQLINAPPEEATELPRAPDAVKRLEEEGAVRRCTMPNLRAHDLCDIRQRTPVQPFQVHAEITARWTG
eukprot:7419672-Pyramimonas_sp.AAC.1